MQIAVLLGEVGPVGERDLDVAGLDPRELGADGPHQGLAGEAFANPAFEGGILGLEAGQHMTPGFGFCIARE